MLLWWLALISAVRPVFKTLVAALLTTTFLTSLTTTAPSERPGRPTSASASSGGTTTSLLFSSLGGQNNNDEETTTPTATMDASLIPGSYSYGSSVNFDNYLKELGVPYLLRTLAGMASPTVTVSKRACGQVAPFAAKAAEEVEDAGPSGIRQIGSDAGAGAGADSCLWTVRTDTLFKSHEVSFRLNEWSSDVTMDGRKVAFVMRQVGPNHWLEEQRPAKATKAAAKTTYIGRTFTPGQMKVALKVNKVEASSVFNRV